MHLRIMKSIVTRLQAQHKSGVTVELGHVERLEQENTIPPGGLIIVAPEAAEWEEPVKNENRDQIAAQHITGKFICEHIVHDQSSAIASERLYALRDATLEAINGWAPEDRHIAAMETEYPASVDGEYRERVRFQLIYSNDYGATNY